MAPLPPNLRGTYNRFGWTANGTEPWGLQKDPLGADGYLFFRGSVAGHLQVHLRR